MHRIGNRFARVVLCVVSSPTDDSPGTSRWAGSRGLAAPGAGVSGDGVASGHDGHIVGFHNNTDFLRSAPGDTLLAQATPVFSGRTQQLWRVVVTDVSGRGCAVGQVRLHNILYEAA